jgi:HEAT repeat protein
MSRLGAGLVRSIFALLVVSLTGFQGAAQQIEVPVAWIDISDRALSFDELAANARRVATSETFWLAYTFRLRDGVHVGCDEHRGHSMSFGSDDVRLHFDDEGADGEPMSCDETVALFLRFEDGDEEVFAARLMTLPRAAGRLQGDVVWAGEYGAAESIAFLRPAILGEGSGIIRTESEDVRERLLSAVAVHRGQAAVEVVFDSVNPSHSEQLRESGVFWISRIGDDEGLRRLLDLARNDSAADIRKQSIFWLGQVAGERVTEQLEEIVEGDPDVEVQTSAVFALSQSEDERAIDSLVRIVRTHDNREVVKSALFWLGQSGDPRAVELLEELLFGGRD